MFGLALGRRPYVLVGLITFVGAVFCMRWSHEGTAQVGAGRVLVEVVSP